MRIRKADREILRSHIDGWVETIVAGASRSSAAARDASIEKMTDIGLLSTDESGSRRRVTPSGFASMLTKDEAIGLIRLVAAGGEALRDPPDFVSHRTCMRVFTMAEANELKDIGIIKVEKVGGSHFASVTQVGTSAHKELL